MCATWNKTYPLSATVVSASSTQLTDNWNLIEAIIDTEHYSLNNALSGLHDMGKVAAFASVTSAGLAALSSPGSGALAFDSSKGATLLYNAGSWLSPTATDWAIASQYNNTTAQSTFTANTWVTLQPSGSTTAPRYTIDELTEFSAAASAVTVSADGYYFITGSYIFGTSSSDLTGHLRVGIRLLVDNVEKATLLLKKRGYPSYDPGASIEDILYLTEGQVIKLQGYTSSNTFAANPPSTYVSLGVVRLS